MSAELIFSDLKEGKMLQSNWLSELQKVNEELQQLNVSSEKQFLEVGEKLQYYSSESRRISGLAVEAAGVLSGETAESGTNELQTMLDRIEVYLSGSSGHFDSSVSIIRSVLDKAFQIENSLTGFRNLVKSLRSISISTRMELSRIKNKTNSFKNLVDDVKHLTGIIRDKAEAVAEKLKVLTHTGSDRLEQISGLQEKYISQQNSILQSTRACLTVLNDERQNSSETAVLVSEKSQHISRSIGGIVTTLQVHDMVRQIIEHVQEALAEVQTRMIDESSNPIEPSETASICRLQIMQLRSALDKIEDAVLSIKDNLNEISCSAGGVSKDISSMTADSGSIAIRQSEDGIKNISTSIEETVQAAGDLEHAMNSMKTAAEEINTLVEDMSEVELEIKLVSINGLINSMHLGNEGVSLTVLADEIKNHSLTARMYIEEVSQAHEEITEEILKKSSADPEDGDEQDDSAADIQSALQGFLGFLDETNIIISEKINRLNSAVQVLEADLQSAAEGITVFDQFNAVLGPIISRLEAVVEHACEQAGDDGFEETAESMELLKQQYTMDKEREVHQEYLEAEFAGAGQNSDGAVQSEAELEDNIELF